MNLSLQKFAGGGCEVRKVREVEGGRDALLAAKTAVVAESVASGCSLLNWGVACAPFLYEVVDEAERRVFVGVSRGMYHTNAKLRLRGVLCDGRVVRKVRDVPVGMSDAEAKYDLIAESVASGCRLLNTLRQRKEVQSGCVFELVDRAGRRVYVGTAASMGAAIAPKVVQKFAGGGCEVRKVREVEGGRDALLAAKTAVVAESVASGCSLLNWGVACAPFLYEVVDEAERRVFVGVSRGMYHTNRDLRLRGVLCDGRVVRKVRDVPVGMSDAEAKSDLIAESVASGCLLENAVVPRRVDGESDGYLSSSFVSPTDEVQQSTDAFHSKHAATLELHRVGPCPTSRDEGVVYALFDESLSVVYVGQTQYSAVHRAKEHVSKAVRTHPKRKTRLHAAMLRNGKPFSVVALEKIDVGLSGRRTFRETAVERERHFIRVLKPTLNTVFRRLACTRRPTE